MLLLARYVIPISSPPIENGAVLVSDGLIKDVDYATRLRTKYPDEPVHDFGLAALMPGFIDTHTHLEYSAMRGLINDSPYAAWKMHLAEKEKLFTLEDWNDSALLGALESVRCGITSIADITNTGAAFRAAAAVGTHGVIYREIATMDRQAVDDVFSAAVDDVYGWREQVKQAARADEIVHAIQNDSNVTNMFKAISAEQLADQTNKDNSAQETFGAGAAASGLLQIGVAPSALYQCHPLVFEKVADFAEDGTPVALHLAGSKEEYDFIRYGSSPFSVHATEQERGFGIDMPPWLATGVSPVQYILNWGVLDAPNVLAIHCVHVDDNDIEKLADRDVAISICSRCNAQLGMGIAPLMKFVRAGMRIGLGTDSPAATDATDMFQEMRIGLLIQRAIGRRSRFLSAAEMMYMATLGGARALRMDDRLGSLDAGKVADVIAIDLSNSNQAPTHDPNAAVVHTATPDNILMTMINGEIVYDGQHRHDIDVDRVFARAEEMRLKLRG
ncbi:MAG: amidohydrolase family protein [Coriobacteriales bacterium]|jgi:5-methylthioadenosine/S-adenosylhomocysteine deaminase|nr:amidohydrolase family protein [Coriobacteriales bacterium]